MNTKMVKSQSELNDLNNNNNTDKSNNETISNRLARYLEHMKHLKKENTKNLLEEAETRLVEQQELHANDLEELREQYETQLRENRENLEKVLKSKLKFAETAMQRDKNALEHATKTLSLNKNLINESECRVSALEQTNSTLNETVHNLQLSVETEHSLATGLDNEVKRLQKELALKIEQYQHQQEIDFEIDLEIAAFDKLLSHEEKRIKLLTSASQ